MKEDPVIDRVREARREISARFDHDPKKVTEYYMERQKRHKDRLIRVDEAATQQEEGGPFEKA